MQHWTRGSWRGGVLACAVVVTTACGPRAPAGPPVAATPAIDAAALIARQDEIVAARGTACVVRRLTEAGESLPSALEGFGPPVVQRLAIAAHLEHGVLAENRAAEALIGAVQLAFAGDMDGARWAYGQVSPELRTQVVNLQRLQLLLGEPPPPDTRPGLDDVPFLVLGGHRARAEQALASDREPPRTTDDPPFDRKRLARHHLELGGALAALGRFDELREGLAAGDASEAAALAEGWLSVAVLTGEALPEAVAAVIRHRRTDAEETRDHMMLDLVPRAAARGHAEAMAPLIHAVWTTPASRRWIRPHWLYRLALLTGADADADEIAADVARGDDAAARAHLPLIRAALRGTPDELLAAIAAYDGEDPFALASVYLGVAWARVVAAGLPADLDARFTAAACGRPPGCLADEIVAGAAVRVTPAGLEASGGVVATPDAAADHAALAATLGQGRAARCVVDADRPELSVVLTPGGSAQAALDAVHAGLAAGYAAVTLHELAGADAAATTGLACRWTEIEPATDVSWGIVGGYDSDEEEEEEEEEEGAEEYDRHGEVDDRVHLSVLVDRDTTWIALSRLGEQQPIYPDTPAADVRVMLDELRAEAYFQDRDDAELAVDAAASTDRLAQIVFPLCERFPDLALRTRDTLSARLYY